MRCLWTMVCKNTKEGRCIILEQLFNLLSFNEALIISLTVFFVDWICGIVAALRSGRHVKSSIMRVSISLKAEKFFTYMLIGLAFHYTDAFHNIAAVVVIIPAIPELLSIFENIKIARTKIDTKPKSD